MSTSGRAVSAVPDQAISRLSEAIDSAGLGVSAAEFVELATTALRRMHQGPPVNPVHEIDRETRRLFEAGGMTFAPLEPGETGAVIETATEYAQLLADSGTVRDVAKRIGRTEGRVRQMLRARELFAMRDEDTWRVPWFQFDGDRPVRGLGRVTQALPEGIHPVGVRRLLTSANPDLELDGRPVSPLDWLRAGADPDPIVELAADL